MGIQLDRALIVGVVLLVCFLAFDLSMENPITPWGKAVKSRRDRAWERWADSMANSHLRKRLKVWWMFPGAT